MEQPVITHRYRECVGSYHWVTYVSNYCSVSQSEAGRDKIQKELDQVASPKFKIDFSKCNIVVLCIRWIHVFCLAVLIEQCVALQASEFCIFICLCSIRCLLPKVSHHLCALFEEKNSLRYFPFAPSLRHYITSFLFFLNSLFMFLCSLTVHHLRRRHESLLLTMFQNVRVEQPELRALLVFLKHFFVFVLSH